jgi:AcrR family transcriptional regulator
MPKPLEREKQDSNGYNPKPTTSKGRSTRERLLVAAKEIFEENGFLDARISDIAKRANLSHGSFYHYFESKEEIFREVAELQEFSLLDHTRNAEQLASAEKDPLERIKHANRSYLEWYRQEARIMGVIELMSRYDAEINAVRLRLFDPFADRTRISIERLQREGLASSAIDAGFAGDALGAMVARIAELWLAQDWRDYKMDHVVDQLTLLWANAIGLQSRSKSVRRRGQQEPNRKG